MTDKLFRGPKNRNAIWIANLAHDIITVSCFCYTSLQIQGLVYIVLRSAIMKRLAILSNSVSYFSGFSIMESSSHGSETCTHLFLYFLRVCSSCFRSSSRSDSLISPTRRCPIGPPSPLRWVSIPARPVIMQASGQKPDPHP